MGIFTIFSVIFKFFSNGFQALLKFATTYPKLVIAGLVLAAAAYGGIQVKHSFDDLKQANANLVAKVDYVEKEKEQLRQDRDAAVEANKANIEVIDKLSVAAENAKDQIAQLQKMQQASKVKIEKIELAIKNSKPEDDGPVAKVLKDTIQAIQEKDSNSEDDQ